MEFKRSLVLDEDTFESEYDQASSIGETWHSADTSNVLPSLYPCYLPYEAQHVVLTTAQTVLEACCFDFAKQWLPDLVLEQRWNCATAVELNQWTHFLDEKKLSSLKLESSMTQPTLRTILTEIRNLRDVAVFRVPTTARGISQLLQYAKIFSTLLQDRTRAAMIDRIKESVDDKIYLLELNKKILESTAIRKLHELKEQHAALKRQEQEIISDTLRLDLERGQTAGQTLQHKIEKLVASD